MARNIVNTSKLPPFAALRAFYAVGAAGGVRRASEAISTDHTVISRHVKILESWLGVSLLSRVGRNLTLTSEGAVFHARISDAFVEIADATAEIMRHNRNDHLRIRSLPGFGFQWLSAHLGSFRLAAPSVQVDVRMTDEAADLVAEGIDIDIRFVPDGAPPPNARNVRDVELARPYGIAVGRPDLIAGTMSVERVEDILRLPLLHEEDDSQWRAWFQGHGLKVEEPLPGPTLWHAHVALEAARAGQGIAIANALLLRDDLEMGRLAPIGPAAARGFPMQFGSYRLFARTDRWDEKNIARFRRWIVAAIATDMAQREIC